MSDDTSTASQNNSSTNNNNSDDSNDESEIRNEILAAQAEFEEDVKTHGLYVTPEIKYRFALALSKSQDKDELLLSKW